MSIASIADGVVIGSQIITTLAEAAPRERAKAAEEYCARICGRRNPVECRTNREVSITRASDKPQELNGAVQMNGTIYSNGYQLGLPN